MNTIVSTLTLPIVTLLGLLLGSVTTWCFIGLGRWLHHNAWLAKHQRILAITDRVMAAAELAVKAVEQAYVSQLKASGKPFDAGAQANAKDKALDEAKRQLGALQWQQFVQAQGSEAAATSALNGHIEAAVHTVT